jgi:hypothetical protein
MSTEGAIEVAAEDGRDFVTEEDVQAAEAPPAPERPEWLPEKYKTGEDLAKAYKELESKLGAKDDDIRKSIIEEIQAEAFADRPETAGDYQLPESISADEAVDNELLKWWSEHSFENGYSQAEFEQGIEMYAQAVLGSQPDLEAESAKLGDNANARIDAASAWASKFFPEETMPAIERMCESHEGIIALEVMMDAMKDGSFAADVESASRTTEAELRQMMQDPRYYDSTRRDPTFVKQVEDGFKQIYRS